MQEPGAVRATVAVSQGNLPPRLAVCEARQGVLTRLIRESGRILLTRVYPIPGTAGQIPAYNKGKRA